MPAESKWPARAISWPWATILLRFSAFTSISFSSIWCFLSRSLTALRSLPMSSEDTDRSISASLASASSRALLKSSCWAACLRRSPLSRDFSDRSLHFPFRSVRVDLISGPAGCWSPTIC
ncbi:hypothetical protein NP493_185g02018 [Ridgeia piscesae]|uniref:Uncharacterized protein n=1 Tax=Ridgeia piscesae TaxID=27915 RepID=A0AAD9UEV6_RIDPI|nr:hypothetical protein NP493_185g02018 [Ridgeia piscesae]